MRFDDYKKALRALGYIEGKNIAFEYRSAEGEPRRFPALADELVRLKVDLIVANSTTSAKAAKNATRTIPIVFSSAGDPVAVGLIDSLARPGGNLTGFSNITSELTGKRMEFLKETVPKLSRVAVLRDSRSAASTEEWKESLQLAQELDLQLHPMEVSSADKFESAFKEAVQARSAALLVTGSGVNNSNHKRIADLTLKHRLPAISRFEDFVDSGGLMSYGNDAAENYKRVAYSHRQNPQGRQARRSAGRTTDEFRVCHQPQNRQADRCYDSAERAGASRSNNQMRTGNRPRQAQSMMRTEN